MSAILVLTNVSTLDNAKSMARNLIAKKLCACINITSKCHSIYYWQDKIEETEEYTLLIKTTANKYKALEQAIKTLHPYELPEIIAINIAHGLPEYLNWIDTTVIKNP
jgi:periplasmic divalent cation tolerance protein